MIFPLFETFLESIYKIFGNEGINCSTLKPSFKRIQFMLRIFYFIRIKNLKREYYDVVVVKQSGSVSTSCKAILK